VRLIGERNVERIEFVWQYVQALITGGWAGLWERIQQDLSQLQSMVVDGIKNWLMERVVMAAITRLATMWNPAGAIINLIMTAWNVYQWIRENAQRMFGLIQAVVDSMSEIASGNITRAANFIENTLARLVPVAISLLANLLGLSGISDRIREIVERIQGAVDRALDRLIERVMAMFRGGGKGDDKKQDDHKDKQQVGEVIPFQAAKEQHKLWIEVKGGTPTVMVASTPMPVESQLARMHASVDKLPADKQATVSSLLTRANSALTTTKGAATRAVSSEGGGDQPVVADEQSLAEIMRQLFDNVGEGPHLSGELSKQLVMAGESHTLFVKQDGAALIVEMASRRTIFADLIARARVEVRDMGATAPAGLAGQLQQMATRVHELQFDFVNLGQGRDAEAFVNQWLDAIAAILIGMGRPPSEGGYGLHSLETLGHPSVEFVEGNQLKPQYRGTALRATFYGSFSSAITGRWKSQRLRTLRSEAASRGGAADQFWCVGVPSLTAAHCAPVASAQIDHIREVATHWNDEGHNQTQAARVAWNNDEDNLQLLCQPCNNAKSGPRTNPTVGPNFRGPDREEL
jgi:5-methylcytosine-specific restriction endonuclease McrA